VPESRVFSNFTWNGRTLPDSPFFRRLRDVSKAFCRNFVRLGPYLSYAQPDDNRVPRTSVTSACPHESSRCDGDLHKAGLISHAVPLHSSGKTALLKEAEQHQYVLLGELHGENEIPDLISALWPSLWEEGYRHVAAEVSPWAATHLQSSSTEDATPVPGLWTRSQAAEVTRLAAPHQSVLWGCDIEEAPPDRLIRQMTLLNPKDVRLHDMLEIVFNGYSRKRAPELLRLGKSERPAHDVLMGDESLWKSTLDTLQVEALRSDSHTRYLASDERERVMKDL